jgi:hypothetical protein
MKKVLIALVLFLVLACTSDEEVGKVQYLAVCAYGGGCTFSELLLDQKDVDVILGKEHFWANAGPEAVLILEGCRAEVDEERTLEEIHRDYGGSGEPEKVDPLDIARYYTGLGCLACDTETKRISFALQSDEVNGDAYFFINFKDSESYMPNAAYQQFYKGGEGIDKLVIDQRVKAGVLEQYIISEEGEKYLYVLPLVQNFLAPSGNDFKEAEFKAQFKKTGKKRSDMGMLEEEYEGKDAEGADMKFWLGMAPNVCLADNRNFYMGMYGIGYFKIEGMTYILTEVSIPGYKLKVTEIVDGSYSFNPVGYQRLN